MSKSMPNIINPVKKAKENNDTAETAISLEKIRQAGICRHYEQLRGQGLSPKECLEKTADFARISERHAKGILTGNIQPTGEKTNSFSKYLEEIEKVEFELPITGKKIKRRTYPEIRNAIENDPKLNDKEKRSLKSEIERAMSEARARNQTENGPSEEPRFNSFAEAIDSLDAEDTHPAETPHQSLDDIIKKFDSCK